MRVLHIRPMPLPHVSRSVLCILFAFLFSLAVVVNVVDAFATKLVGFFANFRAALHDDIERGGKRATGWALDWRNTLSAAADDVCKLVCMRACDCEK